MLNIKTDDDVLMYHANSCKTFMIETKTTLNLQEHNICFFHIKSIDVLINNKKEQISGKLFTQSLV